MILVVSAASRGKLAHSFSSLTSSLTTRTVALLLLLPFSIALAAQVSSSDQQLEALIASKQLQSAEKIIVARLMNEPQNPDLVTFLAEVRLDQGRPAEALQLATEAEQLAGPTALRAQIAGLADSALGHLGPAETQFRRAIQLDPKFVPAHYYLARLLYTRNRFDEAIQESQTTISLSPGFVRAYENLGLCYEGKDNSKEAERWYREAVRLNDESQSKTEWPLLDLATLLIRNNRIAEAKPFLQGALVINPGNAQAYFQMGILLEKSGDGEGALDQFRQAIKRDPTLSSAYYRAARLCQKLGHQDEARRYFDEYKRLPQKN